MAHEMIIRDCGGKEIGRLFSTNLGWRAKAAPGSTPDEIDLVMEAADPAFTRMMEARRSFKETRPTLRLVAESRR